MDWLLWIAAVAWAAACRFDFALDRVPWLPVGVFAAQAGLAQVVAGHVTARYRSRHPGGADELAVLSASVLAVSVLGTAEAFCLPAHGLPRSLPALAFPFALVLCAGVRYRRPPAGSRQHGPDPCRRPAVGRAATVAVPDADVPGMIGRDPVDTGVTAVGHYLTGRRVLVTGAGGSIGSELCRQIHPFAPAALIMLDRDESALHAVQLSIYGQGLLDSPQVVLADIRDRAALDAVFAAAAPEVVFHAAALKHLPLLERYPDEAWNTNVIGTLNVLEAAAAGGVSSFVNISTDKAADPTSALGWSKRLGEQLTSWMSRRTDGPYLSVRFGNVLGSRGSVLHSFQAQIDAGGPVTVTDPRVTRYFMTVSEACQLVIQAGAIGRPGEALVLDMGEPVRILDLARRMIAAAGAPVEIVFTGLRRGEKLHESRLARGEDDERRSHPLISHVVVPPVRPQDLAGQWRARIPPGPAAARDCRPGARPVLVGQAAL